MDDRTSPSENAWPVTLGEVLEALRSDDEVEIDLGAAGVLSVRWTSPARPGPDGPDVDHLPPLGERAQRVLQLVAEGLPAAVVAESLATPMAEVGRELSALRARYGVVSTAAAVDVARRVGDLP